MGCTVRTLIVAVLVLAGCGSDAVAADADYFAGLDPAVVEEVLAHPVARAKIDVESGVGQESMAQSIVRNFIVCRDAHRAYRDWMTLGEVPRLAPLPMPDHPREPSHSYWFDDYSRLESHVASGDPAALRDFLTNESGCGQWIPANPGEPGGPTIRDAVEGRE